MAISQYFNNYDSKYNEQRLVEDLVVESIKIMGFDAYYLMNNNDQARDLLFGEDPVKHFTSAYQLEFYLSSATEYTGEREFFSKFGLEIKNNVSVIVSKRSFSQRVPQETLNRPREGDLIYIPFLNGTGELYEIKFTNQTKDFFMLGRQVPYFYELELEKFKYSQELIATGVADIDSIVSDNAYNIQLNVSSGAGDYMSSEIVYQSPDGTYANSTCEAIVQNWNIVSEILTVTNISGEFVDNHTIYGLTSGTEWSLHTYDPLDITIHNDQYDNQYTINQASAIVDNSEINSFGSI